MITDLTEPRIKKLLQGNYIGSLGFIAHKAPFVLPVTYYYDHKNHCVISYSMEGHKIEALRESPEVALLVYERTPSTGGDPCSSMALLRSCTRLTRSFT